MDEKLRKMQNTAIENIIRCISKKSLTPTTAKSVVNLSYLVKGGNNMTREDKRDAERLTLLQRYNITIAAKAKLECDIEYYTELINSDNEMLRKYGHMMDDTIKVSKPLIASYTKELIDLEWQIIHS